MKSVEIHFTGAAQTIAGEKTIRIELDEQATYRDIIKYLALKYPALIGVLVANDGNSLLSATLFNRNGEVPIMPEEMILSPQDGERIVILHFIVGGCS